MTFKKIFIIFTLLYVLFFVKTWGSVTGFVYSHDDVFYYAQTASLVNDFDIDIKNNLGERYKNLYLAISPKTGRIMAYQPLGPSLLYVLPYVATKPLVYLISLIKGAGFDQHDPLFFVVLCFFSLILFYGAGKLIQKTLSIFFEQSIADITAIFTLWGTVLPVYVFRRPIFGVIPEFFTASLLAYYLAKSYQEGSMPILRSLFLGLITGFLIITRWNDIYLFPACFIFLACFSFNGAGKVNISKALQNWIVFILPVSFFMFIQILAWIKTYGSVTNFLSYYYQIHKQFISSSNTIATYIKNLIHLFFGIDWGIIFTMPILLFGGVVFIFNTKIKILQNKILQILLSLLTFWLCFHVVLQWKNTGEFYGYRFLLSLLPFCAIGFANLIGKFWAKNKKIIGYLVLIFCLFNFFIILPFELNDKTTLMIDNITPMGGKGWGNNYYFINALKFYFTSDIKTLVSNFSRGYLAAFIFSLLSMAGFDVAKFNPKIKTYFNLAEYKHYISFVYIILIMVWFYFLLKKRKKMPR